MRNSLSGRWVAAGFALALAGCGLDDGAVNAAPASDGAATAAPTPRWPASLRIVGEGYPKAGDACRIVGETAATANYLDDSATLVGCRDVADTVKLGGKQVAVIDGVTLVSVIRAAAVVGDGDGKGDATVAGTSYNATAQIPCSGYHGAPDGLCDAGVQRGSGVDGGSVIEIKLPDGRQRVLYFTKDHAFLAAGSAQSDGTAGYATKVTRKGDGQIIQFGPERYEAPDVFLSGD
jgi:hypothetical protein